MLKLWLTALHPLSCRHLWSSETTPSGPILPHCSFLMKYFAWASPVFCFHSSVWELGEGDGPGDLLAGSGAHVWSHDHVFNCHLLISFRSHHHKIPSELAVKITNFDESRSSFAMGWLRWMLLERWSAPTWSDDTCHQFLGQWLPLAIVVALSAMGAIVFRDKLLQFAIFIPRSSAHKDLRGSIVRATQGDKSKCGWAILDTPRIICPTHAHLAEF